MSKLTVGQAKKLGIASVEGDKLNSPVFKNQAVLTLDCADHANADDSLDKWTVNSFAQRENTGVQPVGDDLIVEMKTLGIPHTAKAGDIDWSDTDYYLSWIPYLPALENNMNKELAMQEEASDEWNLLSDNLQEIKHLPLDYKIDIKNDVDDEWYETTVGEALRLYKAPWRHSKSWRISKVEGVVSDEWVNGDECDYLNSEKMEGGTFTFVGIHPTHKDHAVVYGQHLPNTYMSVPLSTLSKPLTPEQKEAARLSAISARMMDDLGSNGTAHDDDVFTTIAHKITASLAANGWAHE